GFESFVTPGNDQVTSPGADTEGYFLGAAGVGRAKSGTLSDKKEAEQTYYRPPRVRRTTLEQLETPGAKTRKSGSGGSAEYPYQDSPDLSSSGTHNRAGSGGFTGYPGRDSNSPAPAYFRDRADSNENLPRTDYAVREVDQYYRGAALSDLPTRKLKTGPADPNSPAANAQ
ncbi:hypothetical protein LTR53_018924, partial [Teratosphaeriaceae sp. CCFEE 6253]